MPRASTPPTDPIKNFETNVNRVAELLALYELIGTGPGKPAQRRSDVAAAAIVMTLAAADTYFGDRLAADFQRCFHALTCDQLSGILASLAETGGNSNGLALRFAEALQSSHPKELVVSHFRDAVQERTYQEPGIVQRDVELLGVRGLWGDVGYSWSKKFGGHRRLADKIFREWAWRRNDIAHRSGRARGSARAVETKARPGRSATRTEAMSCLDDFSHLVALVDFHLNARLYDKQPRIRQSELAIFNLEPNPLRHMARPTPTRKPADRVRDRKVVLLRRPARVHAEGQAPLATVEPGQAALA